MSGTSVQLVGKGKHSDTGDFTLIRSGACKILSNNLVSDETIKFTEGLSHLHISSNCIVESLSLPESLTSLTIEDGVIFKEPLALNNKLICLSVDSPFTWKQVIPNQLLKRDFELAERKMMLVDKVRDELTHFTETNTDDLPYGGAGKLSALIDLIKFV